MSQYPGRSVRAEPPSPAVAVAARVLAVGLIEALYRVGVAVGSAAVFLCGGFVPVLRGWLDDEIASWPEVVAALGGVWVGTPPARAGGADLGPVLGRADAPALFDDLTAIARKLGARSPHEIRLTYLPCCGVTAWGRTHALMIGLPLLYVLNQAELRAVLAHELAHLARGDATRAARRARFAEALARAREQARQPPWGLLGLWARLCEHWTGRLLEPVARGQEARADRVAAVLVGGDATASALFKVAIVQALFREVLAHYDPDDPALPNLYGFFREFWARLPEPFHAELRHRLFAGNGPARTAAAGVHPDLLDRLRQVQGYPPVAQGPDGSSPAAWLLGDLEAFEQMLHNRLYGAEKLAPSVFHRAKA